MKRYIFEIGNEKDDDKLRRILESIYIPCNICLAYTREPSFFNSLDIEGEKTDVIVCRDTHKNCIAGFGTRSIRQLYVNGKVERIGYLSNLRSYPEYRGGTLLFRGYQFLKKNHKMNPVPFYITTIIEDNIKVRKILEGGRTGLPFYTDIGRFWTFAFKTGKRFIKRNKDFQIHIASEHNIKQVYEFINNESKNKTFFPFYNFDDFKYKKGKLKGLGMTYILKQSGKLVGTASVWDQTDFKQYKVIRYNGILKYLYHFSPILSPLLKIPKFPAPGKNFSYFYISLWYVKDNNPDYLKMLLERISCDYKNRYDYFLFGVHQSCPLLTNLKSIKSIKYRSRLYIVTWDQELSGLNSIKKSEIYLEAGTL
jgi:hypothetical protein